MKIKVPGKLQKKMHCVSIRPNPLSGAHRYRPRLEQPLRELAHNQHAEDVHYDLHRRTRMRGVQADPAQRERQDDADRARHQDDAEDRSADGFHGLPRVPVREPEREGDA